MNAFWISLLQNINQIVQCTSGINDILYDQHIFSFNCFIQIFHDFYNSAGFCVIAQDRICPERYTTFYQSVVLRGRVRIVEQPDEKMDAVRKLCARYVPLDSPQSHQQTIDKEWSSFVYPLL